MSTTTTQHGGKRIGSGRKPTGRTRRTLALTNDEYAKVKALLDQLKATN